MAPPGSSLMALPCTSPIAPPGTPLRPNGNFMNIHGVGTYFILLRSWHRAQQPPGIRIGIPGTVVEESAIE